ncbi:hypothetical protein [Echinimonas agarilytica]|uniref:Solute-binding protein family 3/N-terminal domain-containing protein n=1 Tax=Echinimonas agarilytica TaxID=1215918 RepID=A0AA41W6N1_9GAMM|nr:hypothetical protein [Echinimonas agarilytica]MCM2679902.1 hypothetical protein [Echinimonas agarilytica]
MNIKTSLLLLVSIMTSFSSIATTQLIYNRENAEQDSYIMAVLEMALEKSGQEYELKPTPETYSDSKVRSDLSNGSLDVYWTMTSTELENSYLPVRVPIFKGLLGSRIFIINQGEQGKFDHVNSFADLQKLTAGQGRLWPDTEILSGAGIPVATAMKYESLFFMLEGERFDYYPRGVHEPWSEVERYSALNLEVEKGIMLVYRAPMYFFVNQNNPQLAADIERGFETAIADGSFNRLFFSHPVITSVLDKANLEQRKVFEIENPMLSAQTPIDRKELWLDVDSISSKDR